MTLLMSMWRGMVQWECHACGESGFGAIPSRHMSLGCIGFIDGGGI